MKLKHFLAWGLVLLFCVPLAACGEPIQSAEGDPLFRITEPAETAVGTTGSMVIESARRSSSATTATTALTTKVYRKDELTSVSFSKKEIIKAAKLNDMYLSYGYMDVDGLSASYGDINVYRDNGMYTIPEGHDLHYVTEIELQNVPHGKTVVLTGTVFVKVLVDTPDYPGVQIAKIEETGKFTLTKYVA